jgi:hypothetical protein
MACSTFWSMWIEKLLHRFGLFKRHLTLVFCIPLNDRSWPIAAISGTQVCMRIRGGSAITRAARPIPRSAHRWTPSFCPGRGANQIKANTTPALSFSARHGENVEINLPRFSTLPEHKGNSGNLFWRGALRRVGILDRPASRIYSTLTLIFLTLPSYENTRYRGSLHTG